MVRVRAIVDGDASEAHGVVEIDPWYEFVFDLEDLAQTGEAHAQLIPTESSEFSVIFEDWDRGTDGKFRVSCELRGVGGTTDDKPLHCALSIDEESLDRARRVLNPDYE